MTSSRLEEWVAGGSFDLLCGLITDRVCEELLRVCCDMEGPLSSERAASVGCDDVGDSVRDGIRVDGKW